MLEYDCVRRQEEKRKRGGERERKRPNFETEYTQTKSLLEWGEAFPYIQRDSGPFCQK